ncbi:OB-fold domain-containing protein [Sphingobium sp.]|uniref:Zn-ribbon domain-containing OB-fold protein n=1 Tax=Sphingobium sp. TaxID=1912891 RepID=UPI002B817202|nr:OB-fold domain-containing protein [Sphingobium sp.]HUD91635.1 OB-fold domain-containing protein [Sphingobium sp.]
MHNTLHVPIADDLIFQDGDGIALLGSRERATNRFCFPARTVDDTRYDRVVLPRTGRLWSWTVQRFRPKSPPYAGSEAFEPYAVGYVELEGALIIEGRLVDVAFDDLAIGMAMRIVPLPFEMLDGSLRTSFGLAPDRDSGI